MKNINKILAVLISVVTLISITGFTANAATANIFDGYKVTILDKESPAVTMRGRTTDRNVMCFVSASGTEVGTIPYSDYNAIIQKNQKVVKLSGGGTYGAPPVEGKSWEAWFADEFNKSRGLTAESRKKAVATDTAETVEKYRQEIISLVNAEREKAGLPALYADEKAMEYAQIRAQELVTSYSHTRTNGLEKPDEEIGAMNENAARGQWTPAEVMHDWMNSPGHRANILNEDAYAIGVGCYPTEGKAFYWAQEFLW